MVRKFLYTFLLIPIYLSATEYAPWFGTSFQLEGRASAEYQTFNAFDSNGHSHHYKTRDFFGNLSLSLAIDPVVLWPVSVEIETLLARTHHRSWGLDSFKLTGRYQWMDDILGDPVSLTGGLSLILPVKVALHDISSFHHGIVECEAHVAVGKEFSLFDQWTFRHWGLLAIGVADRGSPWFRGGYFWEKNFCNGFSLDLFFEGLLGLGSRRLHAHHFHGYGGIRHRSIDLGVQLNYQLDCFGVISLAYTYRPYARNFPKNVNCIQLSLFYPFAGP